MVFLEQEALDFLARVTRTLVKQPDPDLAILELMSQINAFFETEAISIFIWDESAGVLVLEHAVSPISDDIRGLKTPLGQGVVGWVARYNEPLIVPAPNLDPRFFSGVDERTGFYTRTILCVPIAKEGQVLGAIEALNKTSGHFNDDDRVLLQEIARVFVTFRTGLWRSVNKASISTRVHI
jgi:sigma-B regulation protein RsbU (phosphoserine phosphatase)